MIKCTIAQSGEKNGSFDSSADKLLLTLIEFHAPLHQKKEKKKSSKTKLGILSKRVLHHNEVVDDLLGRDSSASHLLVVVRVNFVYYHVTHYVIVTASVDAINETERKSVSHVVVWLIMQLCKFIFIYLTFFFHHKNRAFARQICHLILFEYIYSIMCDVMGNEAHKEGDTWHAHDKNHFE